MQQSLATPDFDELVVFLAVAQAGSFVGAGRRLGRDATAVSRRLQALEGRLGVRLAERTTRSLHLTEAGNAYLERVRPLLAELEAADREAAAYAGGVPRGRLRLALPSAFGQIWLTPILSAFLRDHPQVTIEAEFSNRFVDLIGERFDLAVRLGVLPDSRLIARKVAARRRLVCASPDYLAHHGAPTTPQGLASHACLLFSGKAQPNTWEFIDEIGFELSVPVSGTLVSDDAQALVAAAVEDMGVIYATDWLVGRELAAKTLVPILTDWAIPDEGGIYVVTPSVKGLPSKTRAFADVIAARLSSTPWLVA